MNNSQISKRIQRIAEMMSLLNANPYKINSYQKVARIIETHPEEMGVLIDEDRLKDVHGIGETIGKVILYLAKSGGSSVEVELKKQLPEGIIELLDLPGLGLAKVKDLWHNHGIDNLSKLETACETGRLESLKGFGTHFQSKLLKAITFQSQTRHLFLLDTALQVAHTWQARLSNVKGVERIELTGPIRRTNELIEAIDFLLVADTDTLFQELSQDTQVVRLENDLMIFPDESGLTVHLWISSQAEFSQKQLVLTGGSQFLDHLNVSLAGQGLRIENNIIQGQEFDLPEEAQLCQKLGVQWIEPELRDHFHNFPTNQQLISDSDIKGIFHAHSTWSDGVHSLEEMAESACKLGYQYLGISDHSQAAYYANGLKSDRVRDQWLRIDELNDNHRDFKIFKGIEADILKDGSLDYDEDLLAGFDFVIASIHSHFHLDPVAQTDRIIRALQSPFTTMLGHPTGRMLLAREGYAPDINVVIEAAAEFGKMIEINTTPKRLDLDWRHLKKAKSLGVKFSINPDAHRTSAFNTMPLGVMMARKGGLCASDVLNTRGVEEIEQYFKTRRAR